MVDVSLFPSVGLEEARRKDLKPIAVGALELYPDMIDRHIGIPSDALSPILQMLIAGRFKWLVIRGTKFRYRSACLVTYSLQSKRGEDDLRSERAD